VECSSENADINAENKLVSSTEPIRPIRKYGISAPQGAALIA
jgi:hypothetical protein